MSQFEVVSITLSFILGLSMSHILWTSASAVRARKGMGLHWIPFGWAACIFFLHAHFFINVRSIDLGITGWTWSWYLTALLLAVLLFASGALVLPSDASQRSGQLLDDFFEHGRLSLLPLAAYLALQVPVSMRLGTSPWVNGNLAIMFLTAVALSAYGTRRTVWQGLAVLAFGAVQAWAMIFVWSSNAFT
jgi:hypothetical protein